MVGQRKRRRTTKHTVPESQVSHQTTSTTQIPSVLQASPQTNSGILVLPSLSRDPHLVQTMQESLSNHSILPRRCCKLNSKGYLRKVQKLLSSKPIRGSVQRKEAGKILDTDSRACRKGKHSDNPYLSGRSSHSLKYLERSRCSSRSRNSSSCYPSKWQLGTEDLKNKSDKNIDSNSLTEIFNCATLNRTPYDHRLNSPLKTETGCQCRLKHRHGKAIQIPSKRIRSRTSCKLKKLKQLVSKHFSSVVAQQTQTSFKSNSHGKASRLGSYSLQQYRAYSGEEDNKKKAKFHNYGGYSPSETSIEKSQDYLSRIEKISKPPKRIPSGRKSMDDADIRGPPWSLHLANDQEIANYVAESVDYDYCLNACPKMIRCECKADDDIDNDESEANDYNPKNWEYTGDNEDLAEITDGNIINARDDLDNEGYLGEEVGQESYNGDSSKSKKWKNVGFCPDINCNRKCRQCSEIKRETQCECENSRPAWSPYNGMCKCCKCCKCAEATNYNPFNNNYKQFCTDGNCDRKCLPCGEATTKTPTGKESAFDSPDVIQGKRKSSETTNYKQFNNNYREFCTDGNCDRKCLPCREVTTQTSKGEESTFNSPNVIQGKRKSSETTNYNQINNNYREFCTNGNCDRKCLPCREVTTQTPTGEESTFNSPNIIKGKQKVSGVTSKRDSISEEEGAPKNNKSRRSLDSRKSSVSYHSKSINGRDKSKNSNSSDRSKVLKTDISPLDNGSANNNFGIPSPKISKSIQSKSRNGRDKNSKTVIDRRANADSFFGVQNTQKKKQKDLDQNSSVRSTKFKENTSTLDALGEIPVHIESYSNQDTKRKVPESDSKSRKSLTQIGKNNYRDQNRRSCLCIEAITQTSFFDLSCYCDRCGIAMRQVCRRYINSSGPRRRASGTETSTFGDKHNGVAKNLPDNHRYCTENHQPKGQLKKSVNRSRKSSEDRRHRRQNDEVRDSNSKTHQKRQSLGFPNHFPPVVKDSKSDLRQIIDILQKAVTGLELQQSNKAQKSTRNGMNGGRDSPLCNQERYVDCQQFEGITSCPNDTCGIPFTHRNFPPKVYQEHCCQNDEPQSLYYDHPVQSPKLEAQGTPIKVHNIEGAITSHPNPNVKGQSRKSHDSQLSDQTLNYPNANLKSQIPPYPGSDREDLSAPYYQRNVQVGGNPHLTETNAQVEPNQMTHYTACEKELNPKDQMSVQAPMYQGQNRPIYEADRSSPVHPKPPTLTSRATRSNTNFDARMNADSKGQPLIYTAANLNGQTLYYQEQVQQGQIPSYPNPNVRSPYPHSNQLSPYSDPRHGDKIYQGPMPNHRFSNSLANETLKDFYQKEGPLRFQTRESNQYLYYQDSHSLPQGRKFNTSKSLDEQQHLTDDGSEKVQFVHRYDLSENEEDNPTRKCNTKYNDEEAERDEVRNRQKTFPMLDNVQSSSRFWRVGFTDLHFPKDNKFRKSSGQSDVQSRTNKTYLPNCEKFIHESIDPIIQATWPLAKTVVQRRISMNPLRRNSFSMKQYYRSAHKMPHQREKQFTRTDKVDRNQVNKKYRKELPVDCNSKLKTSQFLPRNEPSNHQPEVPVNLNCNSKNEESIPTIIPRSKHHKSHASMSRLTSYDKHILRDFRKTKEVPWEPSKQASSGSIPDSIDSVSKTNCGFMNQSQEHKFSKCSRKPFSDLEESMCPCCGDSEMPKRDNKDDEPKASKLSFPCMKPKEKRKEAENVEPKPSTNLFACCKMTKKEKKSIRPKHPKSTKKHHQNVEPKPSKNIFSCFKKPKKEKREHSKDVKANTSKNFFPCCKKPKKERRKHSSDVELKPSRNLFACCKMPSKNKREYSSDFEPKLYCGMQKKEKKEHSSSDVEPKPSRNIFACCSKLKKEKGEHSSDVETKPSKKKEHSTEVEPKPSKNIFACCSKLKREKKDQSSDIEPKPSKNIFACCSKLKTEKKEHSTDIEPKPSKNIFACCSKLKTEKKEQSTDIEAKPSKNIFFCYKKKKEEVPKDVEAKPSRNIFACCKKPKKEKKEPKEDVERKPSKNIFSCCKKLKIGKKKVPKDPVPKDAEPKPSTNPFKCCKRPEKEERVDEPNYPRKTKEEKAAPKNVKPKQSKGLFPCCRMPSIETQESPNGDEKKGSKSWKRERISREKPEPPPKPQRERSQEEVKPKLGSLFSCRSKPKMEKRHKQITEDNEKSNATFPDKDKEVKVLFPCNSRFGCECSSDEDAAICYNTRSHHIAYNKHDSTPVCSFFRSQSQSTNATSSCDCESMDSTTDEHCECSSENHFYILFENQNSYNCKLQRRR